MADPADDPERSHVKRRAAELGRVTAMRRAIVAAWIACLLLAGALVAAGGGDSRHAAGPAPGGSVGLRIPMHDAAVCGRHAASLTECGRFGGAADQDDFR